MTQQLEISPTEVKQTRTSSLRVISGAVVLLLLLMAIGIVPRLARQRDALAAVREAPATHPVVALIHAKQGEPTSELLLPGNIEPLYSANLYARVDGYLDRRTVDIGAKVKAGEVLAVISSPEVDQQLLQARATLAQSEASLQQAKAALEQAQANAELARLTKERDLPLGQQRAISQQIVDGAVQAYDARVADVAAATANITAAEANVTANRANVSRLQQMQSFERIVAPFDGVITQRNVERGDLVSTGNPGACQAAVQHRPERHAAHPDRRSAVRGSQHQRRPEGFGRCKGAAGSGLHRHGDSQCGRARQRRPHHAHRGAGG